MKKLMLFIIISCFLFSACSSQKVQDEEALKAELKEEIKKEMQAEEDNHQSLGDNIYILKGILQPDYPPFGPSILLEEPLLVQRNKDDKKYELHTLLLPNDDIYDYVDRQAFVYDPPFLTISEDADIHIEIEGDLNSFVTSEGEFEEGYWMLDHYKTLSVNGNTTLVDHSNDYYSREISEAIFFNYCYNEFDNRPKDVTQGYYYINTDTAIGTLYKNAVDMLLESGLHFNQGEGDYYISEEKTVYLDGEVQEKIEYKLNVADFVKKYPPTNVVFEHVSDYGENYSSLIYEGQSLSVTVRHESDDYKEGVIADLAIWDNDLYMLDDFYVGMSLPEAHRMAEEHYGPYGYGDPAAWGDQAVYGIEGTPFALRFNVGGASMNSEYDIEEQVVNIVLSNHIE